jgi:4-amino-4-deoxy-L-arabinose transferase-like glycosyltransferase
MSDAPLAGTMSGEGVEESRAPVSYKWLVAILLAAFLLRLGFMLQFTPIISGDGCEYIRMGIELRDGKPLTGSFDWPETMYGTLYPVLIAGVSKLGFSAEHAAYLLSLLFGTGLVLAAFLLARYVYGTRVGYLAAVLFAVFPIFIGLSGSVFNETIYLTLWLFGIYWSIRALDSFRPMDFLLAGVFFGLSTLSRPEAFAYPVFIIFAISIVALLRKISWLKALRGAALVFGAWLVLMAPYAAFQHRHTGQYRFEGKWNINYTLGNRIDAGMGYFQAGFTMDDKLKMIGPLLDSSLYAAYTPYSNALPTKLRYFAHAIRRNWLMTYEELFSVDIGGPVTILLVVLGLFGRPWDSRRMRHEFILVVMAISIVFLLLTAAHIEHRYAYPLPVICLLWAAAGLDVFRDWITRTLSSLAEAVRPYAHRAAQAAVVLLCAALVFFSSVGMRTDWFFMIQQKDFLGIKDAGQWLHAQPPSAKKMFGFEGRVAYYADATIIIFPYTDSATALRYLESKNVDYIVLDSLNIRNMPTMGEWFAKGVPDPRARLVFESRQGTKDEIKIYRWDGGSTARVLASSQAVKEQGR